MYKLLIKAVAVALAIGSPAIACETPNNLGTIELYPSAEQLPSNLLRIYIYFPYPVRSSNLSELIELKDADSHNLDGVFLSNRYDLWSPDRRRLTLLLDPGRVKTGLRAHETLGRALVPGKEYSLIINVPWKEDDVPRKEDDGCGQGGSTIFKFSAIAPDNLPPNPDRWRIISPTVGTVEPLSVDVRSPHDHVSLAYRLRVRDAQGSVVAGSISLGQDESVWYFTPKHPWSRSQHSLVIDGMLEDLAGNRPSGLFDRPSQTAPMIWTKELSWYPKQ